MVPRRRTDALRVNVGVQACLSGASFHHHFWKETQGSQTFSTAKGEGEPTWQDLDGPHESGRRPKHEPKDFRSCGRSIGQNLYEVELRASKVAEVAAAS
jgi:hypothetical protein